MTSETIARQPKGIPVGGQFAATSHAEPGVALAPAVETLAFDHDDWPFEVERDGDGRYTIYAASDEGDEIASFAYTGDASDRVELEAAAVAALTEQKERLARVATRGAHVVWTDPDGGGSHLGRVVTASGEVITVALVSGGEVEAYGSELAQDEAGAATHRTAISRIDAAVTWTNPLTGEKVPGRSLGEIDKGQFAFQVPGSAVPFTAVPANELELSPPAPPGPPVKFIETQRKIRGHNFYAPKAILSKVPALGATEGTPLEDKKVHLHYFTGGADWYIMEVDPSTGRAFGFLNPNGQGGHWGFVSLPDLEKVNLGGYRVVERDCHFSQGNLAQATRYR